MVLQKSLKKVLIKTDKRGFDCYCSRTWEKRYTTRYYQNIEKQSGVKLR